MSGPRHVVTWPRAAFYVDGKHVVVERGGDVPKGVDDKVLEDLRVQGAIALSAPVEKATTASTGTTGTGAAALEGALPAKSAARPVWDAAATALGLDPADFAKKPELVEAVTKANEAKVAAEQTAADQAAAEEAARLEAERLEAERIAAEGSGD